MTQDEAKSLASELLDDIRNGTFREKPTPSGPGTFVYDGPQETAGQRVREALARGEVLDTFRLTGLEENAGTCWLYEQMFINPPKPFARETASERVQ